MAVLGRECKVVEQRGPQPRPSGFEPRRVHFLVTHFVSTSLSLFVSSSLLFLGVAQSAERVPWVHEAGGSRPSTQIRLRHCSPSSCPPSGSSAGRAPGSYPETRRFDPSPLDFLDPLRLSVSPSLRLFVSPSTRSGCASHGGLSWQPWDSRRGASPRPRSHDSVAQSAEAAVSETVQWWFESTRGHSPRARVVRAHPTRKEHSCNAPRPPHALPAAPSSPRSTAPRR